MNEQSTVSEPTFIFHITELGNLASIACHGLFANSRIQDEGIEYVNIAYAGLQDRRAATEVPIAPYGCLHEYVPFYFAPRSPMLYTISRGNVPGYQRGQATVLHLVSTVQLIANANISFVFTDGHAIVAITNFYNRISDLENIDWDVMRSNYWSEVTDFDRRRRRQAEFLVYQRVPQSLLMGIGVLNREIAEQARIILSRAGLDIPVRVRRNWYY